VTWHLEVFSKLCAEVSVSARLHSNNDKPCGATFSEHRAKQSGCAPNPGTRRHRAPAPPGEYLKPVYPGPPCARVQALQWPRCIHVPGLSDALDFARAT
jgi:hypothetical protein